VSLTAFHHRASHGGQNGGKISSSSALAGPQNKVALVYRLGKRVISQFIRTGCRRRLRLDLYQGVQARRRAHVPEKDAQRPGLALLTQQGKEYERAKFRELEDIFPELVVRGPLRPYEAEEDRAFEPIELDSVIDGVAPNQIVLEAQFPVTNSFKSAHALHDLENGVVVAGGHRVSFDGLRPDIIQVRAAPVDASRIVTPAGALERIGPNDRRMGLRVIDIKISGEPSPAHFAELAYYGMALAGWLQDTKRSDRFVVLAEAAIWPGTHDGSIMHKYLLEDRAGGLPVLSLDRYLNALDADLEAMPPEVVLGRIQRFLEVDLREVLSEPNWQALPWHIDNRCSGCDYLGYRWSRHDSEAAELRPARGPAIDARYCWPMAEATQHLSRVAGLTEGACGKLREAAVPDIAAVSTLAVGNVAFEQHQMLRAKRTVLQARAVTLRDDTPARIPDRAGTSAVLPRFADIRAGLPCRLRCA
jgi:DNA replication ATP-dependent helicase Dna2